MTRHAMPFLIINYGAEMLFILEQRLQAQGVAPDKQRRVLQDLATSMFAPKFVQELMRPQELYTTGATKEIFDRLAHSSIMRLSGNSMDKLYDLMTMGVKHQIYVLKYPHELVELTLVHLENLRRSLGGDCEAIEYTVEQFTRVFRGMSSGQLQDIRHQLLSFFQGKRIKVSLFLQEGMQNGDGTFNLFKTNELPSDPPTQPVGNIKYYNSGVLVSQRQFAHPDGMLFQNPVVLPIDPFDRNCRHTKLGTNVYLIERKKPANAKQSNSQSPVPAQPPPKLAPVVDQQHQQGMEQQHTTTASPLRHLGHKTSFRQRQSLGHTTTSAGAAALNSLAGLISSHAPTTNTMHINLFGTDDTNDVPQAMGEIPVIEIGRREMERTNAELVSVMKGLDLGSGPAAPAQAAAGGDLLDLMDQAY